MNESIFIHVQNKQHMNQLLIEAINWPWAQTSIAYVYIDRYPPYCWNPYLNWNTSN